MTRRERLEAVINREITEELIEECKRELEKLNAHGAAALAKPKETKQYKENRAYGDRICEFLKNNSGQPYTIADVMAEVAPELTRQRMTAICTSLVREGRIGVVDVKIKGKGIRKAYFVD